MQASRRYSDETVQKQRLARVFTGLHIVVLHWLKRIKEQTLLDGYHLHGTCQFRKLKSRIQIADDHTLYTHHEELLRIITVVERSEDQYQLLFIHHERTYDITVKEWLEDQCIHHEGLKRVTAVKKLLKTNY